MKFKVCVFVCFVWCSSPASSIKNLRVGLGEPNAVENKTLNEFEDKWFVQKLDHFNPTDTRTWKQVSSFLMITNF